MNEDSVLEILNKIFSHKCIKTCMQVALDNVINVLNVNIDKFEVICDYMLTPNTHITTSKKYLEDNKDCIFDLVYISGFKTLEEYEEIVTMWLDHISPFGMIVCENPDEYVMRQLSKNINIYISQINDLNLWFITNKSIKTPTNIRRFNSWEFDDVMAYDKYVLVAMAKGEYHDIYDWVQWNLNKGFDKIVLYDNNDINSSERYDELLSEFITNKQLEIVNIRGIGGVQQEVYNEFYRRGEYKWLAVFDCDEYLDFDSESPYQDFKSFVDSVPDAQGYMIPWKCIKSRPLSSVNEPLSSWNELLPNDARRDSYNMPLNTWMKSIYKYDGKFPHISEHALTEISYENYKIYDENGAWRPSQVSFINSRNDKHNCFLRHYLLKDIDAFFYNKYLRGHAGISNTQGVDGYQKTFWAQNLNYFAEINRTLTEEEQLYLLSKGIKYNFTFRPTVHLVIHAWKRDDLYYKKLCEMLTKLPDCDLILHVIISGDNMDTYRLIEEHKPTFQIEYYIYNSGLDLPMTINKFIEPNYYKQPQLFAHIGYPVDTDPMNYLEILGNTILKPYNFDYICRQLCFYYQDGLVMYAPKDVIYGYPDQFGWDVLINDEAAKNNWQYTCNYIDGNSFITNLKTYKQVCETSTYYVSNMIPNANTDIIEAMKNNISTIFEPTRSLYLMSINNNVIMI